MVPSAQLQSAGVGGQQTPGRSAMAGLCGFSSELWHIRLSRHWNGQMVKPPHGPPTSDRAWHVWSQRLQKLVLLQSASVEQLAIGTHSAWQTPLQPLTWHTVPLRQRTVWHRLLSHGGTLGQTHWPSPTAMALQLLPSLLPVPQSTVLQLHTSLPHDVAQPQRSNGAAS